LRGINVGGHRIVRMADLRGHFEAMGFADVETFIQSGNVVFSGGKATAATLVRTIERALTDAFGYPSRVVVLSAADLQAVVAEAPAGFGAQPDEYRYDVIFVRGPLTPRAAFVQLPMQSGVDEVHAGRRALYFRRLISKASQSHVSKIAQRPIYQSVTVRNWNTTMALLKMATG
jgi:uncharacterized protein (DUF1697 family)